MNGRPPAEGEETTELEFPAKTETSIRRLLRRAARRRIKRDSTPFALDTNPNREFARLDNERPILWFFGTLPVFMILYSSWGRIGAG